MGYYAVKNKHLGTVSKTVTVNYPKSDTGGSRSVVVEEPIYVDVYVESEPFEHSVGHCDNSLHRLQAGIVATEVAEKKSRLENSKRLGKSLDDGFFQVVNCNLTMQAKEESANAKALVGALFAQQKELLKIKERMEGDYNLIKTRYVKLFEDYDKELHSRVYGLNKRTFRLVEESAKEMMRPTSSMLMTVSLVGQKENFALQTKITASRVKHFASQVILRVKDFIESQNLLNFSLKAILARDNRKEDYYIPVMCMQTSEGNRSEFYMFTNGLVSKDEKIASELEQQLVAPTMKWSEMREEDKSRITESLSDEVNSAYAATERDRRVGALIMKLWQSNIPMVLTK